MRPLTASWIELAKMPSSPTRPLARCARAASRRCSRFDFAISLNALKAMKAHGRAALILRGVTQERGNSPTFVATVLDDERSRAHRVRDMSSANVLGALASATDGRLEAFRPRPPRSRLSKIPAKNFSGPPGHPNFPLEDFRAG